jgi:hypothetical protein
MASASSTINLLDSSDDDQDSIPPSSGLTFLRSNEPELEPEPSRPSHHPPPARVSMSTHKKARTTSIDATTTGAGTKSSIATNAAYGSHHTQNYNALVGGGSSSSLVPKCKKLDAVVWLVYHQKEPYYHSAWSYDSHLRFGPSSIDKICVGVYDSKILADAGAKYYWEKQVRKPLSSGGGGGLLGGYFYDGMDSGCVNTLSHRVCVEQQSLNPVRPSKTEHDTAILKRRGRG